MSRKIAIMVGGLSGGGMERVVAQLSEMLSNAHFDVYLFVCGFDKRKAYHHKGSVVVFPDTFFKKSKNQIIQLGLMFCDLYTLTKLKRKYKIDVTISFSHEMNILNMLSRNHDRKILTIHSCHSIRNDFKGFYFHKEFFKLYNYSYQIIAVSKWCKRDLVENYGINENKIKVIYNPVDEVKSFDTLATKENIVLVVGRFHDVKQQWHIIRAFQNVLHEIPDAELVLAGEGYNRKYLKKLATELGMEHQVVFKGFVTEIEDLYKKAKVVALSSASEACPCSVIEAISNGVPVVAPDCPGGIREIIASDMCGRKTVKTYIPVKCGVLVPVLDGKKYNADIPLTRAETELSKGILYLLKNENIRKEMAKNCIEFSELFKINRIAKKWIKVLGAE